MSAILETWPTAHATPGSKSASRRRLSQWNFSEWFVLGQTFLPGLLYLPGSQSFRILIRLSSYAITLGALIYFWRRSSRRKSVPAHPSTPWLGASLAYLVLMLAHPETNSLLSGMAQIGLYLSVLSPVIWAPVLVETPERLNRLLWLLLICNGINSLVGVMQVRDPGFWMPREFSTVTTQSRFGLEALVYQGAEGRTIIRPPGLSDAPGAVAGPAVFALYLGMVFVVTDRNWWKKALAATLAAAGAAAIFLSFVRSSLLIALGMAVVYFLIQLVKGRVAQAGGFTLVGVAVLAIAFGRASEVGGQNLIDRFDSLRTDDKTGLYHDSRGNQVAYAFTEQLPSRPLGSGLGRWGMMNTYFGDSANQDSPPIWVEIQWPALIVDGGVVLLFLYSTALVLALSDQGRETFRNKDQKSSHLAGIIFAANCGVFALCFSYPVFLAPIGMQYWFLTGALQGVVARGRKTTGSAPMARRFATA